MAMTNPALTPAARVEALRARGVRILDPVPTFVDADVDPARLRSTATLTASMRERVAGSIGRFMAQPRLPSLKYNQSSSKPIAPPVESMNTSETRAVRV